MRHLTGLLASAILVTFFSAAVWSSEADELREKAKAFKGKAESLAKQGRHEEAEKLNQEATKLLQAAEKQAENKSKDSDREVDELHQQLKAIAEKEQHAEKTKNKEALGELRKHRAGIERELAKHREQVDRKSGPKSAGKHSPESDEPTHEAARRIKHLHVAIENLHAAGMHELAEDLAKKAEAMQRELHHAQEKSPKEKGAPPPEKRKDDDSEDKHPEPKGKTAPDHAAGDDLRHELKRLRAELNELREEIKKRP